MTAKALRSERQLFTFCSWLKSAHLKYIKTKAFPHIPLVVFSHVDNFGFHLHVCRQFSKALYLLLPVTTIHHFCFFFAFVPGYPGCGCQPPVQSNWEVVADILALFSPWLCRGCHCNRKQVRSSWWWYAMFDVYLQWSLSACRWRESSASRTYLTIIYLNFIHLRLISKNSKASF